MSTNVAGALRKLGFDIYHLDRHCGTKYRVLDAEDSTLLLRYDNDGRTAPLLAPSDLGSYNFVVFSDYGKGAVSNELILEVIERFKGPIFLDTKKTDLSKFGKCIIKINADEWQAARHSLPRFQKDFYVTYGSQGCINRYTETKHEAIKPEKVVDVCGAGDAFLVGLIFGYLHAFSDPTHTASICAAECIQHVGFHSPSLVRLIDELHETSRNS